MVLKQISKNLLLILFLVSLVFTQIKCKTNKKEYIDEVSISFFPFLSKENRSIYNIQIKNYEYFIEYEEGDGIVIKKGDIKKFLLDSIYKKYNEIDKNSSSIFENNYPSKIYSACIIETLNNIDTFTNLNNNSLLPGVFEFFNYVIDLHYEIELNIIDSIEMKNIDFKSEEIVNIPYPR